MSIATIVIILLIVLLLGGLSGIGGRAMVGIGGLLYAVLK